MEEFQKILDWYMEKLDSIAQWQKTVRRVTIFFGNWDFGDT